MLDEKILLMLNFSNNEEVEEWCGLMNCSAETMLLCSWYTDNTITSIEAFLSKNREWVERNK